MTSFKKIHNEPLSALTHLVGLLLSIAGLTLMVIFAALWGTAAHVVGFSIFGASLILLYAASSFYHFLSKKSKLKILFQRLDHAMIFILIAGTYTPLALTMMQRGWGWSIFGVIWGLGMIGFLLKIFGFRMKNWVLLPLYLGMGWLVLIAFQPITEWLKPQALLWLTLGGVLYTLGILFYMLESRVPRTRWFGMHDVFHILVMAGSFSHFWLMLNHILYA